MFARRLFYRQYKVLLSNSKYSSNSIVNVFNQQKFLKNEESFRRKDEISEEYELIYRAPLETCMVILSNFLTGTTALLGAGALYVLNNKRDFDKPVTITQSDVILASNVYEFSVYIIALISFHTALKVLVSRYVLRMYKRENEYLAVFAGHILNKTLKHKFHVDEFKKLKPTWFVSWGDSRYGLGNKKGILLSNYFKSPAQLNVLLKLSKADITKKK